MPLVSYYAPKHCYNFHIQYKLTNLSIESLKKDDTTGIFEYYESDKRCLKQINDIRQKYNLPPFSTEEKLKELSYIYAVNLAIGLNKIEPNFINPKKETGNTACIYRQVYIYPYMLDERLIAYTLYENYKSQILNTKFTKSGISIIRKGDIILAVAYFSN
ncbi:hypothetical protein CPJCM30710_18540 [Clostridium polyendosporum]|uniref:Uncharacterized protein n=1 Tax=Clostridium polyendosporum TaxID=69208 RepID=A0A919S0S6_9CLOT|nr:hypothetical protein [Clostridium polyendosporum]GIM29188.1 hypothetical protein CPJCM30710_18540 [Clostridium polyendosporum]